VVFIILSKFLLFNLLSGIFVLSVFENCRADDKKMLQEQLLSHNSAGARLLALLRRMDVTGEGSIHMDSLDRLLGDPMVTDQLDDLGVDPSEVAVVFKLLDVDGAGFANIDELMVTLIRLRSHTQGVDLPSLLHESRKIGCHLVKAVHDNYAHLSDLKRSLVNMQRLQNQSLQAIRDMQRSQAWNSC